MSYKKLILVIIISLFSFPILANTTVGNAHSPDLSLSSSLQDHSLYDGYPWSVMYYYGETVSNPLLRIVSGHMNRWPEHIQSIEFARTLDPQNFLRRLVNPLVGVVQIAANVTQRNGSNEHTIYEWDPYLIFRWSHFPWNHSLTTSLAIAEGISYTSSIPSIEKRDNNNTKRLLNYLMLEATFSHPAYTRWQLVVRIHHRSGAYGVYHAGNSGSNDVGLGIRYLFG